MSLADPTRSLQEFCYGPRTLVPLYTEIHVTANRRHLVFQPINSYYKTGVQVWLAAYPALGAQSAIWACVQIPPQITVLTFFSDNCVSSSQPEAVLLWLVISNDC